MATPKQSVQFFFGPVDVDKSKKNVKIGDLVQAKNCQMLHAPELIKRGAWLAQSPNTYENRSSIIPDLLVSPDGAVKLTADSADDVIYAQSAAGGEWKSRGGQQRLTVRSRLRFPSTASDKQTAPMIKQAGNWFVWMEDEGHFRYAQQDADGTRLLAISAPIAVAGPTAGSGGSSHVKSFAIVLDATFDANNLWIYWVDWTWNVAAQQNRDAVWAMRVPLDWTTPEQYVVSVGSANNRYILTSISATTVGGVCYLVQSGVYTGAYDAVEFRSYLAYEMNGWAQHFTVTNAGVGGTVHSYLRTSTARSWAAGGVCWLSSQAYHYVTDHMYYAMVTQHASDRTKCVLVLVDVTVSTGATAATTIKTYDLSAEAYPATLTVYNTYVGQVTGREYLGGVAIACSVRVTAEYDGSPEHGVWTDINTTVGADRVYTSLFTRTTGGTLVTQWTARAAWLAHGVFRRPDGSEFLITGWQDADRVQMCYHLRNFWTGAIVCQFLVGESAFAGGCGAIYGQLSAYVTDIQQPYLAKAPFSEYYPGVVLPTISAGVTGSCDMSSLVVTRQTCGAPASARGIAFVPGGVLTVAGGWQSVQESAPLSFPSGLKSYWGTGSS